MTRQSPSTLLVALGLSLLAGCSTPSVITLNDERELQTVDTPQYNAETGFYEYEQLDYKPARVNKDQVLTIKEL